MEREIKVEKKRNIHSSSREKEKKCKEDKKRLSSQHT